MKIIIDTDQGVELIEYSTDVIEHSEMTIERCTGHTTGFQGIRLDGGYLTWEGVEELMLALRAAKHRWNSDERS